MFVLRYPQIYRMADKLPQVVCKLFELRLGPNLPRSSLLFAHPRRNQGFEIYMLA